MCDVYCCGIVVCVHGLCVSVCVVRAVFMGPCRHKSHADTLLGQMVSIPPGLDPWVLQPRSRPPARESTCGGHRGGQCSPHWRRANCSALIRSHTLHQRSQTAYILGILKSSDRCRQLLSLEQLPCRRPTETRAVWWLAAVCGFNSCSHTHTIDHS